jgi:DNA-binding response OmpR family regulator
MSRALVIDDEFAELEMLALVLEAEGFVVDKAGDGLRALEMLRAQTYDLVLCDFRMPIMSGVALLTTMREDARLAATPFILMTDRYEKVGDPSVPVIVKPVRMQVLRAVVTSLLKRKN